MGEVIIRDYTKRLKPWFHLTVEEKSFLALQSYRYNVVTSEEIKKYLTEIRKNNISNFLFPLLAYPIIDLAAKNVISYLQVIPQVFLQASAKYEQLDHSAYWFVMAFLDQPKSVLP